MLCDVSIASCSSAGVKGWLYFSELLGLKLSFCFSALFFKVKRCGLELLMEEFAENSSGNVSYVFLESCFRFVFCEVIGCSWLAFSRYFPPHRLDSVCSGKESKLVDIIFPTFFLVSFIVFLVFALKSLKALRLFIVGSLLNFRKAALT